MPSGANPERQEARDSRTFLELVDRMIGIGGQRMLFARLNWERLFKSAYIPGALPPRLARLTETRSARRKQELRRRARRSGVAGLLMAIARVA